MLSLGRARLRLLSVFCRVITRWICTKKLNSCLQLSKMMRSLLASLEQDITIKWTDTRVLLILLCNSLQEREWVYFPKRQTAAFSDVKSNNYIHILVLEVGKFGNLKMTIMNCLVHKMWWCNCSFRDGVNCCPTIRDGKKREQRKSRGSTPES